MVEILQRDMYFYLNRLVKSHINITPDALLFLEQAQPQDDYFSDLIIKLSYSQEFDSHLTLQDIEKIIRENPSMEKYFANKKQIEQCILIPPATDDGNSKEINNKSSTNNANQPIATEKRLNQAKSQENSVQNSNSKNIIDAQKASSNQRIQSLNPSQIITKADSHSSISTQTAKPANSAHAVKPANSAQIIPPVNNEPAVDPTLDIIKQIEFELNDNNFKENGRFKKITEIKKEIANTPQTKTTNLSNPATQKNAQYVSSQNNNQKNATSGASVTKPGDQTQSAKAGNSSGASVTKPGDQTQSAKAGNSSGASVTKPGDQTQSAKAGNISATENVSAKQNHSIGISNAKADNIKEEKIITSQKSDNNTQKSMDSADSSVNESTKKTKEPQSNEKKENKNEIVMKINTILELEGKDSSNEQPKTDQEKFGSNSQTSIAEKLKNKLKYLNAKNREGCVVDPDSDEINPEEGEESEEEPPACEPVVDIKEVIPGLENLKINNDIKDEKNKYFESLINKIRSGYSFKPIAKEYDAEIEILKDPTGKLYTDGKVEDFHAVALDKYEKLRKIILQRPEAADASTISQIKKLSQDSEVKFIGMVMEKRVSNNGTIILTLEDPASTIKAIIRNGKGNEELIAKAIYILEDAVILVEGFMQINKYDKSKVVFVNNVEFPDMENQHEPTFANLDLSICCLSDIHFGSKQHMGHLWDRFVQLLKGELGTEEQRKWAGSIKYITIAGDLVDGIGIYPGQEKNLTHLDIYEQYKYTAQRFAELPDYINIIFVPGDHDPVRKALPSPRIDKDIIQPLLDLPNVTCLGAPSMVSLHGIKTLIYHGESMIDINMLPGMSNDNVPKSMKIMLENRHLVPSYGKKTQMAPAPEDHLVIDVVPDIFHTGHLHKSGFSIYKGVALVNAGCFQEQTDFMASLGIVPDCGKIPIINIKGPSFKPKIIDLETQ